MINAAIVGLGRWGSVLVGAVQGASDRISFTRAVVRQPDKHAAFAARHGLALTADYAAVLADPAIDAVVITTPHSLHAGQCIAAAAAGKHILCEKPFALDLAEAHAAFAAADRAGIVCVVGFQRRLLDAYVELGRRLAAGAIGTVYHVEANQSAPGGLHFGADSWRTRPGEFRGGAMGGHGIHVIDAMIGLFGEISGLTATARRHVLDIAVDDTTFVTLDFANGMTGYMGTLLATAVVHRFQVFGTGGWMEIRDFGRFELRPIDGPADVVEFDPAGVERAELEAFADAIESRGAFPVSRAEALHGQAVFDAIARSIESGARVDIGPV
jgi:predicted dehydrogenase